MMSMLNFLTVKKQAFGRRSIHKELPYVDSRITEINAELLIKEVER